jgi:hypothetical protein
VNKPAVGQLLQSHFQYQNAVLSAHAGGTTMYAVGSFSLKSLKQVGAAEHLF